MLFFVPLAASSSNECPVCKDDFSIGDEVKKLPCEHIFHPDCVVTWLKMVSNYESELSLCTVLLYVPYCIRVVCS